MHTLQLQQLLASPDFTQRFVADIAHHGASAPVDAAGDYGPIATHAQGIERKGAGVRTAARYTAFGGANGSIIGRNTFQRPKEVALEMLNKIIDIYLGKA